MHTLETWKQKNQTVMAKPDNSIHPFPLNVHTFLETPTHMPLKESQIGWGGGPQLPVVRQTGLSQVAVKGS